MARDISEEASGLRHKALLQSRREREFYRYYESMRKLSSEDPAYCNLNDAAAAQAHRPRSSPDKALTAFCQLGALRLNAQRAMIFFFDNKAGYVLAESTKTLSLEDDSVHASGDELWLGYSIIPRGCSVCEYTVELQRRSSSKRNDVVNIVDDLRTDARFLDRLFVVEKPNARFYAGVPITTSSGVNIGAYCVLDDSPRNGLDELSKSFLNDMAATIMSHLESIRAKAERNRATQMVDSLGAFVRSTSLSEDIDSWHMPSHRDVTRSSLLETASRPQLERSMPTRKHRKAPKRSSTEPALRHEARNLPILKPPYDGTARTEEATHSGTYAGGRNSRSSGGQSVTSDVQTTFHRAAELVREAIDTDAAMILNASGYSSGLLRRHKETGGSPPASNGEFDTAPMNTDRRPSTTWQSLDGTSESPPCTVLGASCTPNRGEAVEVDQQDRETTAFTQTYLLNLLFKYPKGKCWNFDGAGNTQPTSDCDDDDGVDSVIDADDLHEKRQPRETCDDGEKIKQMFGDVRSFAIVGLWDQEQSKWFGACAVWSFEPFRILSDEYEVNFLAAFGEVVMAEVLRLRLQMSTNSKSDFISSISHELRSPLHGILGSVEYLQEQNWDSSTQELIAQIDICGRTLLDTIDHLLDFSNINHYAQKTSHHASDNDGKLQRATSSHGRMMSLGGTVSLDSDVLLDIMTEEIIDAAVYSFCCSKESSAILDREVSITCDIESPPNAQWMCNIPSGSWKRLVINLLNNALKFTSSGYIKVSLRAAASPDPSKAFDAVLKISDSGCGMSPEFLDDHLFEAFVQEDGLKEGTGLGMSLVAKIVKAFGGNIEVQSEKDVGTTVTVIVPVSRAHQTKKLSTRRARSDDSDRRGLPGVSIGVLHLGQVGVPGTARSARTVTGKVQQGQALLHASIRATCAKLGFQTMEWGIEDTEIPDVYIITEADLAVFQESRVESGCPGSGYRGARAFPAGKAIIVVCDSVMSKRRLVASPPQILRHVHVEYLAQPVGPARMKKSIEACLRSIQDGHAINRNGSSIEDVSANPDPGLFGDHASQFDKNTGLLTSLKAPSIPHPTRAAASRRRVDEVCLLLVDDNEINLKLLIMYTQKQGYDMLTARDGLQAVECYKTAWSKQQSREREASKTGEGVSSGAEKTQVVLMDINMPVMNGFEATRHIRRFEQQMAIKPAFIIALTGLGNAGAQQEAFNCGMNRFLTKPVSLKRLTETLEAIES